MKSRRDNDENGKKGVGRPREIEASKKISMNIDASVLEKVRELAEQKKMPTAKLIRKFIDDGLAREAAG